MWIANNKAGWKPQTTLHFRNRGKIIVDYFGSHIKLAEVDRLKIDGLVTWARTDRSYSDSSVKSIITALRCCLKYAVETGAVKKNPLDGYIVKRTEAEPEHVDFLSVEECAAFQQMLEAETARTGSLFWEAFGEVALVTGMRVGEVAALQWGDYSDGWLTVRRTVSRGADSGSVVVPTKTRRIRRAPVTDGLAQVLDRFHAEQEGKFGDALTAESYIFCSPADPAKPVGVATPQAWIERIKKRYPDLIPSRTHWHLLRHSTGTLVMASTGNIKLAQAALGHSDISTTARYYLGVASDALKQAANDRERMLSAARKKE